MNELKPSPALMCANCEAVLQGEFCHACGQSVHSVLRPVSHMLEDAGDIFFHMDERIVHTVPPLYTKPGFLTLEYFAGRRVRYIAPFRLMFVFCLLAFFFMHVAINGVKIGEADGGDTDSLGQFTKAATADDVHEMYRKEVRSLLATQADPNVPAIAKGGLSMMQGMVRDAANKRLAQLNAPAIAPPGSGDEDDVKLKHVHVLSSDSGDMRFNIGWVPDAVNARLNAGLDRLKANLVQASNPGPQKKEAIQRIVEGIFGVLPQTMFIMIPIFALILKVFYVFRRRLYVEHLIVALHSHAFLFLALMLLTLLSFARGAIAPHLAPAGTLIRVVEVAMWIWMPVYLLLMQKRVYRQGWGMTILKYWLIGSVYFWLLGFALTIAVIIGISH
ncbi:DUF3667 domain-containing protein [Luteibacter aegosomatissinici]|uniref:DUF3667 domain-containing protein n=1 Tax=Luteibacter aegosomatissinici TaxID=2911539 RepID=UPI001FFABF80|nr:DUF3667 domain-containing protein [Luteibacter aegosomatissinici]UPG94903.1 DUF3667 domain-containing protein [Luteibacter aegosomatissinici]